MSRFRGPRLRVMRALGMNLPGLSAKSIDKRPHPPGQHGPRMKRKISLYGTRLREKQKLRYHYGVSERQLRAVAAVSARSKGPAGAMIAQLLERRLDNVVFRAGFARTIPAARQLVNHGHVLLNGRPVDIASVRVKRGDVVAVRERAKKAVELQQQAGQVLSRPDWLDVDAAALSARVSTLPDDTAIPFPIELRLVVEFYS